MIQYQTIEKPAANSPARAIGFSQQLLEQSLQCDRRHFCSTHAAHREIFGR
jgi:hypothetical protein